MNNEGVVIVCGASFANGEPPLDAVFPGTDWPMPSFLGGQFVSNGIALQNLDIHVTNEARAASYSYDIAGTNFRGYESQLAHGLQATTWVDGETKSTTVVFDLMNDCLHSIPFTEAQADDLVLNLKNAVNTALAEGKQVIVIEYPDFSAFDLQAALNPYGITETISEANYLILTSKHEDAFRSRTDITYLNAYDKMETLDGLHQDEKSARAWARAVKKALV